MMWYRASAGELISIGDSITAGASASASNSWPALVAKSRALQLRNLSYGSAGVADYARQASGGFSNLYFGTTSPDAISRGMDFAILAGYNDMRDWGTNASFLSHFERTLDAVVGWLALPSESKFFGTDNLIRRTGDWLVSTNYQNLNEPIAIESTEIGAKAEFELYGTSLFICCLARSRPAVPFVSGQSGLPYSKGGGFELTVDDRKIGFLPCFGAYGNRKAINGSDAFIPEFIDFAPHLYRVTGLRRGIHQVQLTVVSNETPATFIWAAGNSVFTNRPSLPRVLVGTTLRMTPEGYATRSRYGSDIAVDAYRRIIADVTRKWFDDGASTAAVDTDLFYSPASGISTDLVHPADAGHRAISDAFTSTTWSRLRVSRVDGGEVGIEVLTEIGASLLVETSGDFHTWEPAWHFTATHPISTYSDNSGGSKRFFRVRSAP